MPTDEQRHEVAERLRNNSEVGYRENKLSSVIYHIKEAIYEGADIHGFERQQLMRHNDVMLDTLSDLIEPSERTCQFLDDDIAVGAGWKLPASKCSNCGIKWGYSLSSAWHYCPNCGAKVVEY